MISYLNLTSVKSKIWDVSEIIISAQVDIFCTGKVKINPSFPDEQFILQHC